MQSASQPEILNRNSRIVECMTGKQQAAQAPSRLPAMRPKLLLITPPTVGKLTTAADVIAQ